jgi:Asp-tRNA(Asn)/Glu-tRNA(Gln) amidotransferase C subunit
MTNANETDGNNEIQEQTELSPLDKLLKLKQDRLKKIEEDKMLKNFAEAFKLIGRVNQLMELAKKSYETKGSKFIKEADSVISILEQVNFLLEEGLNEEAMELFEREEHRLLGEFKDDRG